MAENKTKPTKKTAASYLKGVAQDRQKDARQLLAIFKDATKEPSVMWGSSIVGFGTYHYKYASGREGDFLRTGFSVRAQNLTIYIMPGYTFPKYKDLLKKLGPHKLGQSCLYIKHLDDIDIPTLKLLIKESLKDMKKTFFFIYFMLRSENEYLC